MIAFLFKTWSSHFITSIQACGGNLVLTNQHLLILDGHNLHVTIDIVHKVKRVGFDLITLPSTQVVHCNLLMLHVLSLSKLHLKLTKAFRFSYMRERVLARKI
jgi:hypothetical protein